MMMWKIVYQVYSIINACDALEKFIIFSTTSYRGIFRRNMCDEKWVHLSFL